MNLTSSLEKRVLTEHHIQIELNHEKTCGIIVANGQRFKVTVDNHSSYLPETKLSEITSKIAIILLKKNLVSSLQKPRAPSISPWTYKITQAGIYDQHRLTPHEANEPTQNTRHDYDETVTYLTSPFVPLSLSPPLQEEAESIQQPLIPSPRHYCDTVERTALTRLEETPIILRTAEAPVTYEALPPEPLLTFRTVHDCKQKRPRSLPWQTEEVPDTREKLIRCVFDPSYSPLTPLLPSNLHEEPSSPIHHTITLPNSSLNSLQATVWAATQKNLNTFSFPPTSQKQQARDRKSVV